MGGVRWGMIWTAAVLVAATLQGESVVDLGLRYLARHQAADGSWGMTTSAAKATTGTVPGASWPIGSNRLKK